MSNTNNQNNTTDANTNKDNSIKRIIDAIKNDGGFYVSTLILLGYTFTAVQQIARYFYYGFELTYLLDIKFEEIILAVLYTSLIILSFLLAYEKINNNQIEQLKLQNILKIIFTLSKKQVILFCTACILAYALALKIELIYLAFFFLFIVITNFIVCMATKKINKDISVIILSLLASIIALSLLFTLWDFILLIIEAISILLILFLITIIKQFNEIYQTKVTEKIETIKKLKLLTSIFLFIVCFVTLFQFTCDYTNLRFTYIYDNETNKTYGVLTTFRYSFLTTEVAIHGDYIIIYRGNIKLFPIDNTTIYEHNFKIKEFFDESGKQLCKQNNKILVLEFDEEVSDTKIISSFSEELKQVFQQKDFRKKSAAQPPSVASFMNISYDIPYPNQPKELHTQ